LLHIFRPRRKFLIVKNQTNQINNPNKNAIFANQNISIDNRNK